MKKEDRRKREKGKKGKREKGKKGKREKGKKGKERPQGSADLPAACSLRPALWRRIDRPYGVRLSFLFRGCRFRGFAGRSRLALRRSRAAERGGRCWRRRRGRAGLCGTPNRLWHCGGRRLLPWCAGRGRFRGRSSATGRGPRRPI